MNFETFETELLVDLKDNNKSCIKKISKNKQLIKDNLGENASFETVSNFVNGINNAIILTKKKFSLYETIFKDDAFARVYRCWKGSDALLRACQAGNKNACKWLLDMNVDTSVQDENGMTALMYAVKDLSLISIVRKLVMKTDDLEILDNNKQNVLYHAVRNVEALNLLLRTKININHLDKDNNTVLLYCCKNDITEPIQTLIVNKDINVNFTDDEGRTAAMCLSENARQKELRYLNIRNCNYDYVSKKGESVISIALKKLYAFDGEREVGKAADYVRIITNLIELGYGFNIPADDEGNTALMIFMLVNDTTLFNYALKHHKNIDLTVKNYNGESACSLVTKLNNSTFYYLLLRHESFDFNYVDPNNQNTLLMLASMSRDYNLLIKEVIENNINLLNSVNCHQENALILATKANFSSSVASLLQYPIHVNQQDELGNTALHYAVELKNSSTISLLMRHQADPNLKNHKGQSALDMVRATDDKSLLQAFDNPSSIEIPTEESAEPSNHFIEILEYLNPHVKNYRDYELPNSVKKMTSNVIEYLNFNMKTNHTRDDYVHLNSNVYYFANH